MTAAWILRARRGRFRYAPSSARANVKAEARSGMRAADRVAEQAALRGDDPVAPTRTLEVSDRWSWDGGSEDVDLDDHVRSDSRTGATHRLHGEVLALREVHADAVLHRRSVGPADGRGHHRGDPGADDACRAL